MFSFELKKDVERQLKGILERKTSAFHFSRFITEDLRKRLKKQPKVVEEILTEKGYSKPVFGDKFCLALRGSPSKPRKTDSVKKWKVKKNF